MRFGAFIDDGWDEPAFIQAVPGLHEEVRFQFRPMLPDDLATLADRTVGFNAEEWERSAREELAGRVIRWSITDRKGNSVPVNVNALTRIRPAVYRRLKAIVMGGEPSDIDPNWSDEQKSTAIKDNTAALASGDSVGQVRDERKLGN